MKKKIVLDGDILETLLKAVCKNEEAVAEIMFRCNAKPLITKPPTKDLILFSKRLELAGKVDGWILANSLANSTFTVISALNVFGNLKLVTKENNENY